jgi:hypothetical protein
MRKARPVSRTNSFPQEFRLLTPPWGPSPFFWPFPMLCAYQSTIILSLFVYLKTSFLIRVHFLPQNVNTKTYTNIISPVVHMGVKERTQIEGIWERGAEGYI